MWGIYMCEKMSYDAITLSYYQSGILSTRAASRDGLVFLPEDEDEAAMEDSAASRLRRRAISSSFSNEEDIVCCWELNPELNPELNTELNPELNPEFKSLLDLLLWVIIRGGERDREECDCGV